MEKQIIEVNGVKMEVDLRNAKVISNYKVGDKVKLLVKEYSSYESNYGVIVGFDQFEKLPTIIVAYLSQYGKDLRLKHINKETEDAEICHINEGDFLGLTKEGVLHNFDNEILKKEEELSVIKRKKEYFIKNMSSTFEKYTENT